MTIGIAAPVRDTDIHYITCTAVTTYDIRTRRTTAGAPTAVKELQRPDNAGVEIIEDQRIRFVGKGIPAVTAYTIIELLFSARLDERDGRHTAVQIGR